MARHGRWIGLTAGLLAFALPSAVLFGQQTGAQKAFKRVAPSVVSLENEEGSGTGIVLDKNGLILTNAHVVASPIPFHCDADVRKGVDYAPVTFKKVVVKGYHPQLDLAIVKVDPREAEGGVLEPAKIARKKSETGELVFVIGNPGSGSKEIKLSKSLGQGLLSGVDRQVDGINYYQTDAPINPGNSGGPLVNENGEVIGVVTWKLNNKENLGFAIPLFDVKLDSTSVAATFVPFDKRKADPQRAKRALDEAAEIREAADHMAKQRGIKDLEVRRYLAYCTMFYHHALLDDPSNDNIYFEMGSVLRLLDLNEVAAGYLSQAIKMNPWGNKGSYFVELGHALSNMKKKDDARIVWREGTVKCPKEAGRAWENLASYYNEEKQAYDAAYNAAVAMHVTGGTVPTETLKRIHDDNRSALDAKEQKRLDDAELHINESIAALQKLSDQRKSSGSKFILNECSELIARLATSSEPEKSAMASAAGAKSPPATAKIAAATTATASSNSTSATNSASPSKSAAAPPGSRDLLSAIDVSRDADRGAWKLDGGALISPVSAGALIRVPGEIPPQYDLALTVERKANQKELVVGFVRGGQQSAFLLDVDGTVSGLDLYSSDAHHGALLTNNQSADVIVKVRKVGLQVLVDGKVIFERRSTDSFPAVSADWKPSEAGKLFLGSQQSRYVITRLTLTPIERKP
jgi:V8-like Glu-specific endopeptidase